MKAAILLLLGLCALALSAPVREGESLLDKIEILTPHFNFWKACKKD